MAERTYTAAELADLADGIRRILASIEAGEMTADSGMVARLEGAWLAMATLAEGRMLGP